MKSPPCGSPRSRSCPKGSWPPSSHKSCATCSPTYRALGPNNTAPECPMSRRLGPSTCALLALAVSAAAQPAPREYENKLTRIADPKPLLADHPDFVAPVKEQARYEAPVLAEDDGADLDVRAWRFSYNVRGII